jgi:signal peptidase II
MSQMESSGKKPFNFVLVGYLLLFLAMLGLDQTTKWHAEKSYLAYSDPQNSEIYRATHLLVAGFGTTPGEVDAANGAPASEPAPMVSKNWLEFNFTYLRNHGAVWGIFSDLPDFWRLGLFYSVTVIAVGGVLFLFRRTPPSNTLYRTALVFILAGALGNFIDRLLLTYVIDFLHFQWRIFGWEYSFPVFNVADISIDVGIGLMILDMILLETTRRSESDAGVVGLQQAT